MISAAAFLRRVYRTIARVFPRCSMISQAIAYNLFLAFFPALLVAGALATSRIGGKTSLLDLITDLMRFLPPGSQSVVSEFLAKRGPETWKIAAVGWTGLMLLMVTIAPLLAAAILGVLGKPLRRWIANEIGKHSILQGWWNFFFPAVAIVLAMTALTVIYRVARPREHSLRNVLPGAMGATLLWWLVNVLFGVYVRRVPYNVVYGGLAAVIGLIIWMQLSAVIIFLGAAWNAELAESREAVRARG